MPLIAAAAIAGIGSIAGGAIAAHGAGQAANAQEQAANQAAQLQHQDAQASLAFQKQEYADQQANQKPFLQAGQKAIGTLSNDLYNGTFAPYGQTFQAPTAATEQNDPGYQFRLSEGLKALDQGAAARGGLISGGTAKAEQQYGQNYASNEYQNVYNRKASEFDRNYNIYEQGQANTYNRLAGIAGVGQLSANQLGQTGAQAANNISNTYLTSGQQIGNDYQNAAAARASGYVAQGNIYGNTFSNLAATLATLFKPSSSSSGNFQGYPVNYDTLSF